jgi:branched-chain amino acid transport system permease protein
VGGAAYAGTGLFAGTALIGLNALVAVAAWAQNPASVLPGLAGMAFGRSPDGVVPLLRRDWAPAAHHRVLLIAAVAVSALLWALRLAGVVNGWVLFWGVALVAVAVRGYAGARPAAVAEPVAVAESAVPVSAPVPVEWWGLRRPWRAEDEEVLDRAVARG